MITERVTKLINDAILLILKIIYSANITLQIDKKTIRAINLALCFF
jgi:hypothetical protein